MPECIFFKLDIIVKLITRIIIKTLIKKSNKKTFLLIIIVEQKWTTLNKYRYYEPNSIIKWLIA